MVCRLKPLMKPGQGWWIRTDKTYRDFELTLEFWMPEGGNSGVGLRGSSIGDPAFTGFEVQILDTHGQEPGLSNCGAKRQYCPQSPLCNFSACAVKKSRCRSVKRLCGVTT